MDSRHPITGIETIHATVSREDGKSEIVKESSFLDRLVRGDADAFEELVSSWYPRLYRTAYSFCREPQDTEEVIQEVFLTAFLKIKTFRGSSSIGSWLTRITVNMALMRLRERRRRARIETMSANEHIPNRRISENSLERVGSLQELRTAIESAVASLPPDYATVFILRECRSYSTAAVADALHVSSDTVKSRLHQAREIMRKKLARHRKDQLSTSEPLYGPHWWEIAA